jgi:hypothetical protein
MGQQNHAILNFDGGLDIVSTHYTNQTRPGSCERLVNYEPALEGGYRRINGYSKFDTLQPTGAADEIWGVYPYADGVIVTAADGVYFGVGDNTWLQVNRDTYTAATGTVEVVLSGPNYIQVNGSGTAFTTEFAVDDHIRISGNIRKIAAIISDTSMVLDTDISGGVSAGTTAYYNGTDTLSGSLIARTSQGKTMFTWYEQDGEYGSIVFTDTTGNNNAARFKITGSGVGRVYHYDDLNEDFGAPLTPKYCTTFARRLILANRVGELGSVFWSDRFSNRRFDGASAGSVTVEAPVIAIKPFKDKLIIFTKNNISQLVNLDDPTGLNTSVLPVAYNTGCAASFSVQELAGDIIFLSHDGIRVLSATDQYGDVQIGVISRMIDPIVKDILRNVDGVNISSTVIRYKNQYRLFVTDSSYADGNQFGILGCYKVGSDGQLGWQWSKLQGIPLSSLESTTNTFVDNTEDEKIFHGGYNGYVYYHDSGNTFDGSPITSTLALNEFDYGDIGLKKTIHYIRLFGDVEGATDDILMNVEYDYNSTETHQPAAYTLDGIAGVSLFGSAVYGTSTFGGESKFNTRILVEGSGYSNKFKFTSSGTGAPYSLNSLYVDLRMGASQ